MSCRNSPVGYFALRNSHKPGKTFLLLCKSLNFLYNPPSLSFSSPSQASNFTYNLKVLSTFFFYPSQIFSQRIFWKSNPMIYLLLRGSKLAQKDCTFQKKIISGIKDRSVEIFQSESQRKKMIERKKEQSASVT